LGGHTEHILEDIIEKCLHGDRGAYYELYKRFSRSMYNVAFRIVHDDDEAHDVLQEGFISAFKNLKHYRGEATFGAWLKRIVVNKAINAVKRKKWDRFPDDGPVEKPEEDEDALRGFPFTVEKVKRAMDRLPHGYRVVLSLYLLEGYDHGEIAEILGISESTSKSQFNRSKKKLRELLLEEGWANRGSC